MPADLFSTLILILLNAAHAVGRVGPYVVGGIVVAALLSRAFQNRRWAAPPGLPVLLATPLAAVMGVVSPLPTTGVVPSVLRLQAKGLPVGLALTFVLASSLLNPQLFILTLGTLGVKFALAQMVGVLMLSTGLGLVMGRGNGRWQAARDRGTPSPPGGQGFLDTIGEPGGTRGSVRFDGRDRRHLFAGSPAAAWSTGLAGRARLALDAGAGLARRAVLHLRR